MPELRRRVAQRDDLVALGNAEHEVRTRPRLVSREAQGILVARESGKQHLHEKGGILVDPLRSVERFQGVCVAFTPA